MIIPVGERFQQTLYLMTKTDGKLVSQALQPTLFVPMTGKAEAERTVLPDPANPALINGDFETVRRPDQDDLPAGAIPGWYYERQVTQVSGAAAAGQHFARFRNETVDRAANLLQGLPLDGRRVTSIRLSGSVRTEAVQAGSHAEALPAIALSFYDDQRREIETAFIGPFRGTRSWRSTSRLIRVPPQSREAIVRIGMFGATGTADFDELRIESVR